MGRGKVARELLQEVYEEHVFVGNEVNYCIFCGRWPDNHVEDCVILRIKKFLEAK